MAHKQQTTNDPKTIGIVGVPPLEIIEKINARGEKIIDLDELQVQVSIEQSAELIPRVYCAILRTVVLNCMHLKMDSIYIDVGQGKCDCALHVAGILHDYLDIPVIPTRNQDTIPYGTPICSTRMPLMDKFLAITKGVQSALPSTPEVYPPCEPSCGFWGVPPRDFSLLTLFPDTTHIFGWTRCMENKTPADLDLEHLYNPDIPMVFFSQSFCAKSALAKHLANAHPRALHVDSDVSVGNSTRAKIEAFLELSGVTA